MTKYYNKDIPDNVHVMYCCRQFGKTYYEFKKLKRRNERLNKIINEMEKFLEEHEATYTLKEFRKNKGEE